MARQGCIDNKQNGAVLGILDSISAIQGVKEIIPLLILTWTKRRMSLSRFLTEKQSIF